MSFHVGTISPAMTDVQFVPPRVPVARRLLHEPTEGAPRDWFGNDGFKTQMFNAMSLMFPDGERYFIDSVRPFLDGIRCPRLKAAAQQFIAQESVHRHQHAKFNAWLADAGVHDVVSPLIRWRIRRFSGMSPRSKLALTVALEHLTASLADGLLGDPQWGRDMHPSIRTFWGWHAIEEIEHKGVAFDIYREIGGGGAHRVGWLLFACCAFSVDLSVQLIHSLHRDRRLFCWSTWRSASIFLFGRRGLLAHMLPRCLAFMKRGFHPWQERNEALIERWLQAHAMEFREIA